jgi:pimeloyl-ACP methyl ester carboxylesterase
VFHDRYSEKVAGMVLVDATHEEMLERLPPEVTQQLEGFARLVRWFRYAMYFGLPRLLGVCGQVPDKLEHLQELSTFNQCRVSLMNTLEQELNALEVSTREVAETKGLDDLPLIVLTRDYSEPEPGLSEETSKKAQAAGEQMQQEVSELSSRGKRLTAEGSGHYVQLDRPEIVIKTIREVSQEVRRHSTR